jgi:hypothetical protein
MTLVTDRALGLLILIGLSCAMYWRMAVARSGKLPWIRPIAGLDAIAEAVGRATELGRPVHYSTGLGALTDEYGPQTLAGLGVLQYVSKLCGEYGTKIICTVANPVVFPLSQEMVKAGLSQAGKPDTYTEDMVRFLSSEQWAYAAGAMGTMHRERVAANIMIGAWYGETLLLAEAALQTGAIQIGSTARMYQLPYMVIVCDYVLIGEEMFAASAYVSRDPEKLGAIEGQDIGKVLATLVVVVGSVMATFGSKALYNFLDQFGK